MPENRSTAGDVVDLLLEQHEEARRLFSQLEQGGTGRRDTFDCVYPALRRLGPEGERAAEAKSLLSDLEKIGTGGEGFDAQLETVRLAVLDHAAAEEREVFPLRRRSIDADTLRSMRNALEAAEAMPPTHPHLHGPESAIGNLVVGPFVAVVDKVRDALRRGKAY